MLKNLSVRLKISLIYIVIAIFTLPMLVASYLAMRHLNSIEINTGSQIVSAFGIVYIVFVVVYVVFLLLLGRKLTSLIVFPLRDLEEAARKITTGDVDVLPSYESRDEVGSLAREFRELVNAIRQQSQVLSIIAGGDYTVSIPVRSEHDIMNLSISQLINRNNEMLLEIKNAASQVSGGAAQIADGAQLLAQGSTEQAASIEELSASINEIADKTKQNTDISREAAELSGIIKDNAEKGSLQMGSMMQAVKEINDASSQISKVIKVIDDIAFQTNILSLNAAVEAARAGQHGKGFAVVADEVRNLASKSAEAAKDTGELIENTIEKAHFGLSIAAETAASLKEIVDGINRSAEIMAHIALSSDEQAASIEQINTGINQVAQVVQQNSATAEESAGASEEMSGQSDILSQLILQFKLKDTDFSLPLPTVTTAHGEVPVRQKARSLALSSNSD